MNKRNFLKSLGAAVVGVYLGLGEKALVFSPQINPLYADAEYDVFLACSEDAFKAVCIGPPPDIIYHKIWEEVIKKCNWEDDIVWKR